MIRDVPATYLRSLGLLAASLLALRRLARRRRAGVGMLRLVWRVSSLREGQGRRQRDDAQRSDESLHWIIDWRKQRCLL